MKKKIFAIILLLLCIPTFVKAEKECNVINGNGKTIGSEIACDSERFYVLSSDENNVKLFAKYNLYTGIAIYKEKINKDANDTRTDAQYCSDLAASNNATVKSDGFYTATGYCFYAKTIDDSVMKQNSSALSAHWDDDGNYLYPQVGDNYMHMGSGTNNPAEAETIDTSVTYSDTRFRDFVVTTDANTDLSRALKSYKQTLDNMGLNVSKIDLLSLQEIEDIVYGQTNQRFPLQSWGNDVISSMESSSYNSTLNPTFGVFKTYLSSDFAWLYSTTYWNKTIFGKPGYGPDASRYSNWWYVFVAQQGKICGAGFYNCAPETQLGCGIRPVVTIPTSAIDYTASEAKDSKVTIKSIDLLNKSDNTVIESEAYTDGIKLFMNLTFYEKDDYATYKVVLKNNTDTGLYINDSIFNENKDYVYYEFDYLNGDNILGPKEEKEFNIKVSYRKEIDTDLFRNGVAVLDNSDPLILSDKLIGVPNTLKNLGIFGIVLLSIVVIALVIGSFIIFKNKKSVGLTVVVLGLLLIIIPNSANALLQVDIPVKAKVSIKKAKETICTYNGTLNSGVVYTNGQYKYTYTTIDGISGWRAELADKESTDPVTSKLCTTISGKPIISLASMFMNSKATSIDLSSFYTSNVIDMQDMFEKANNVEGTLDLSGFDVSKVKNASYMFYEMSKDAEEINIIMPNADWNNVTSMNYMFYYTGLNANTVNIDIHGWVLYELLSGSNIFGAIGQDAGSVNINLKDWNLKKATTISKMFPQIGQDAEKTVLDLTNFKFEKATDLGSMFYYFAQRCPDAVIKGLDTWDMKGVESVSYMFYACMEQTKNINIDLTNWDVSNIKNFNSFVYYFGASSEKTTFKAKNWVINPAANIEYMFTYLAYQGNDIDVDLSGMDLSGFTNMKTILNCSGYDAKGEVVYNLSNWKTGNVTTFDNLLYCMGQHATKLTYNLTGWDSSKVTSMKSMFDSSGSYANETVITGLLDLDTTHVTNMQRMFGSVKGLSIDGLNIYATNTQSMFSYSKKINATINLYNNPDTYTEMFNNTAIDEGSSMTVNYKASVTNIDNLIATKSENSNVIKGELLED